MRSNLFIHSKGIFYSRIVSFAYSNKRTLIMKKYIPVLIILVAFWFEMEAQQQVWLLRYYMSGGIPD